ncbi:uncharacterized protein LOC131330200 isoform X3 [Rhododendron vialii]|uniref:uncharacterized protein LOC131330200 isoform X3 n=1 Tax=Rhododendron vialii TaxID=182163 RepID=UPI00265F2C84|nr:uncharacterized protein LOC131330200 isoform X3 [Rhododendron vialii]
MWGIFLLFLPPPLIPTSSPISPQTSSNQDMINMFIVMPMGTSPVLCVIGLAPTHLAFKDEGGVKAVDFNVGKSDRSGMKVTGKRKKNAQHFESNTALCKVCTKDDTSYIVRCCIKGSLLEVNDRLIKQPSLLNSVADREGYIAIIMPKPADWLKTKPMLLGIDEYKKLRELS